MISSRRSGFTMLELSIVLIIIALVTAIGVSSGTTVIESSKRAQTEAKLQTIEEALEVFRGSNNRLPCPADPLLSSRDTSYGEEASTPGTCTGAKFGEAGGVVEGTIPTKALNIPDEFMYDGWKRKIVYAVDSNATEIEAFEAITIPESCGITVNDVTGNARTTSAIYLLMSFGPDGHGGYLANGERVITGATNVDALTNCHCDDLGETLTYTPEYVQREAFDHPTDSKKSFRQHVRFKERWQLITEEDQFDFAMANNYTGPNLVAGFAAPAPIDNSAYVYKLQCGQLVKQPDLDPSPEQNATGVAFTPNNRYIVVFSKDGCILYPITNGEVEAGLASAIPSCPAYSTDVKVAVSSNDYLAMIFPAAPYVRLWQRSGSSFVVLATPTPVPTAAFTNISVTNNYLMLSDATSLTVYQRTNSAFTALGTQPAGVPASIFSAALSANELYLAVTEDGNVSGIPAPLITIWRIETGPVFTAKPAITMSSHDTPYAITFSPDGKYFVVGGTSNENLAIYKIDKDDAFTRLASPTGWVNSIDTIGTAFAFSKNSRYLAMGTTSSTIPLVLFRKISANEFKLVSEVDDVPTYSGISLGFNY